MRTPLVLLFGSLLVGCTVGDPGTGGDDDDGNGGGAVCGDGVLEGSEACDDGNKAGGDGCSASCTSEASPRLDVSLDKLTLSTELKTKNMLTLSLTGADGFSGPVTLTAAALNGAAAIPGWNVTFSPATVNLPENGTANVVATLDIPAENRALAGTVKFDVTSSAGTKSVTSTVTVMNQVTFRLAVAGGICGYPADAGTGANPIRVTTGTKLRFFNAGTANLEIHSNGVGGVSHQGQAPNGLADPITEANTAYEQTIVGGVGGNNLSWYCHSPVNPAETTATRPGIIVVAAQAQ
jgi:cysteine-rich repeat protein